MDRARLARFIIGPYSEVLGVKTLRSPQDIHAAENQIFEGEKVATGPVEETQLAEMNESKEERKGALNFCWDEDAG
jgi:hypothetical protein